ncbi:thiaminase II [Anaeromyxobacter oryzae]|uniref:Aminopyrimidine aminohydrolase n=1 Tax=Anaeromyxobacter oryzae TaxID=2918170 RepID=A0ABM7WZZ8_9BACT|nr:thiaminase II [Anaeromyxobacter oryzae]BDG05114.1 aminopyrimidine aminohydrolase [Anaeromyxobacter oryzae]
MEATVFRARMWNAMEEVFARILAHPFIASLTDGSLQRETFAHYVVQDAHYLLDYARALALVGAKAPDAQAIAMFAGDARGAIEVERSLHAGLLEELGVTAEQVRATPVMPTTLAYTSYLLRSCHQGSFAEALAAVLPCYWIYAEVGAALLARSSPDPLYARWIATYGGEAFGKIVADVLALVDRVGETAGVAEQAAMRERVVTTSRYEWMFWDAAWRRETWPV